MKRLPHIPKTKAFTLVELLVVITIIALLAGIAFPAYNKVTEAAQMSKSLTNGKSIYAGLKLYAGDNNGIFPSYTLQNGQPTANFVTDSNTAFAQLVPQYIDNQAIFWQAKSRFTPGSNPPPNVYDNPPTGNAPNLTLKPGMNDWAYVLGLNDTSNSTFPLLATGFKDPSAHIYTKDKTDFGGVWGGSVAIVVYADGSGGKAQVNQQSMMVPGGLAGTGNTGQLGTDLFANTDPTNWLGSANVVVNPSKPTGSNGVGTSTSGTTTGTNDLNGSTSLDGTSSGK